MTKRPKAKTDGRMGNLIKTKRIEKGLSQLELAELIGTDQRNISKWESGIYDPTFGFVLKLIKVLEIDIRTLLSW